MYNAPITANFYPLSGDLLQILDCTPNAPFNASGKEDDPPCLLDTRVEVRKRIRAWIDGDDKARTVAREHYDGKRLVATFFFSKGGDDIGHAEKFVSTIAAQLAHKSSDYKDLLRKALSEDQGIIRRLLRDQWRELIVDPLSELEGCLLQSPVIIVVYALDECERESDIGQVIQLLADTRGLDGIRLRVLITSRPELPIRDGISRLLDNKHQNLVLHSISEFVVNHDISLFLKHHLAMIGPEERVIKQPVRKASCLFIWAATACRFIRKGRQFAAKRLALILEGSSTLVIAPDEALNEIHVTISSLLTQSRFDFVPPTFPLYIQQLQYRHIASLLGSADGPYLTLRSKTAATDD